MNKQLLLLFFFIIVTCSAKEKKIGKVSEAVKSSYKQKLIKPLLGYGYDGIREELVYGYDDIGEEALMSIYKLFEIPQDLIKQMPAVKRVDSYVPFRRQEGPRPKISDENEKKIENFEKSQRLIKEGSKKGILYQYNDDFTVTELCGLTTQPTQTASSPTGKNMLPSLSETSLAFLSFHESYQGPDANKNYK